MRPIELSRKRNDGTLEPVYVNPDRIEYFSGGDNYAYVYFGSGVSLHVAESTAQIIGRLADHRSTMRAEEHDGIQVYRS